MWKKTLQYTSLALCLILFYSCNNNDDSYNDSKQNLIGIWNLNEVTSDSVGIKSQLAVNISKGDEGDRVMSIQFTKDSISFRSDYYNSNYDSIMTDFNTYKIEYSVSEIGYLKMSGILDCPNCFKLENNILKYTIVNEENPNIKIIYSYLKQ